MTNQLYLPNQWPFTQVLAQPIMPNKIKAEWKLVDSFNENKPWQFQLQADYEAAGVNWENLGDPVTDTNFIETEFKFSKYKNILPQFRIKLTAENTYYSNPACTLPLKMGLYIQGILRRLKLERTFMPLFKGVLYRRRSFGDKCPQCADMAKRATRSQCPICYGVGFVGGYWKIPVANVMLVSEETQLTQMSQLGQIDPGRRKALFIGLPQPTVGDIWADTTTLRRYKIRGVGITSSLHDFPIVSQVEMGLLAPNDIEYSLE